MTTALWIIAICEMVRMIQNGIQLYTILTERDKREICYDEILKSVSLPDEEIAERLMRKWEERRMSDLISRSAALDIVFDFAEAPHNMYQKIRELPSAEKHGTWVLITNKHIDPQEYMCSVCGRIIKHYGIPELLLERYPYCNCGAKMERSEE